YPRALKPCDRTSSLPCPAGGRLSTSPTISGWRGCPLLQLSTCSKAMRYRGAIEQHALDPARLAVCFWFRLAMCWWASLWAAALRERGKERGGVAAQATVVPPLWGPVPGRQPAGRGHPGRGGDRPVAANSPAARSASDHGGVATRPGRAQGCWSSDHPAVLDHGGPGAGCAVAAAGARRRGRRVVPGAWALAGYLVV